MACRCVHISERSPTPAAELPDYFQPPPWVLHTTPVLLHLLHVNLPNMPLARPPLQAVQSLRLRPHFLHLFITISCLGPASRVADPHSRS